MTTENVVEMPRGSCWAAPIEFICGLTQDRQTSIKVGVLAEVVLPNFHGLGLIARQALDEHELTQVGPIASRVLARPFDFLEGELAEAWASAKGGERMGYLRRKNAGSIVVLDSVSRIVEPTLIANCSKVSRIDKQASAAAQAEIRKFLTTVLENQMLNLIWDTMPPTLANCQFAEPDQRLAA